MADKKERALSFGAQAELYQATRPSYPASLVGRVIPAGAVVVDAGAGTGKWTEVMLAAGVEVTAVEPDAGMRSVLSARFPALPVYEGTGESLPFGDASVDVITYAQVWHWVDEPRGFAEALRVLRPGGRLVLIWNVDAERDWLHALNKLTDSTAFLQEMLDNLPATPAGFENPEIITDAWEEPLARATLLERAKTWSAVATLEPGARTTMLADLERLLEEHPDLAGKPDPIAYEWIALAVVYASSPGVDEPS